MLYKDKAFQKEKKLLDAWLNISSCKQGLGYAYAHTIDAVQITTKTSQ
jgi:hypothetical protein